MKTEKNFHANVSALACKAHQEMMLRGIAGIFTPIEICGVTITCGDDLQSVQNRLFSKLRTVPFDRIDSAMQEFNLPV